MKKSIFVLLSILIIVSMTLTACGAKAAPAKGTITLWHAWKDTEITALNKVIAAFQAQNPDTKFNVLYVPFDDLRGKFETASASGGGPSVLIGGADWGPALYGAGLVADLTGKVDTKNVNTAALGAVQYKNALIGMPETIKGVVMYRNKTIVPKAAKTFDELVANAKAATKGDVQGAMLEYGFFFSAAHLNAVGGTLMDADGNPKFNDAKGVAWVQLIQSFKNAGQVTNNTDDDVNLFKAGKAGIIIDGTWNMTALADAIGKDNLVIDPWPSSLSGYVQTENIYMSANATGDDQNAAIAFINFFMSKDAQTLMSEAGHIPAISGVTVTDPLLQQAITAFKGGAVFPVIPEMGAYWDPMNNML